MLIEDCFIDAGDDALTMKSGRDEEAWDIGRPLENVVIRRCTVKRGHGGFTIGSEMSAGVKNILVEDCHFDGSDTRICCSFLHQLDYWIKILIGIMQ